MRKLLISLVVIVLVLAAAGAWWATSCADACTNLTGATPGRSSSSRFHRAPLAEIRRRLVEAHVVSDDLVLRAALWWSGRSRTLQAGEYRFDQPMSALAVVEKIAGGDVYTQRLTFPEGLTIAEMAKVYESRGFGSAREFIKAASDAALVKDLDPKAGDLEGYLFPETYPLTRRADASRSWR